MSDDEREAREYGQMVADENSDHAPPIAPIASAGFLAGIARGEAKSAKLRAAIYKAGFGIMETSGEWSLHCTTDAAKEAERVESRVISENVTLQAENERLRAELAAIRRGPTPEGEGC